MRTVFLIFITSLLLFNCSNGDDVLDGLPPGSVKVDDEMYMIPLDALDGDGCQGYRAHSPGNMVVQVIFYQKKDGSFTMSKTEAACYAE